jgi:aminopeptidase C
MDINDLPEDEKDTRLFAELDKATVTMRLAARELAELFASANSSSRETLMLIQVLNKISNEEVRYLDVALTNLKKILASISLRNSNENYFGTDISQELLPQIMDKYGLLMTEIVAVAAKTYELQNANQ